MGIAILSGVLDSLDTSKHSLTNGTNGTKGTNGTNGVHKWEAHTPGTVSPVGPPDVSTPTRFIACVSREATAKKLVSLFASMGEAASNVEVLASKNVQAVKQADVVLLCCKPPVAEKILSEQGMGDVLQGKLLISILAGVTISQLTDWVPPSTRVVRAMPNTPCKIREGMTVVTTLPPSPDEESDDVIILKIFSSIGRCRYLDEKHFDAATALAGSGPAIACVLLDAMADGGVMMGLSRSAALELAAQTFQGAARMVLQNAHPAQIKDAVCTPGGCTIAGLLALEDGRVRSTIARGIQAATERAGELGQFSKK